MRYIYCAAGRSDCENPYLSMKWEHWVRREQIAFNQCKFNRKEKKTLYKISAIEKLYRPIKCAQLLVLFQVFALILLHFSAI